MNREEIASLEKFREFLSKILTVGTLYRKFEYFGEGLHHVLRSEFTVSEYIILPNEIRLHCSSRQCSGEQQWSNANLPLYAGRDNLHVVTYICRNCGANEQRYWLSWEPSDDKPNGTCIGQLIKIGQWPPLTIAIQPDLAKALGPSDARLYKQALISATISHGIAALAYMRRVIENKMNDLIDLIADAARNAQSGADLLQKIEEIKASQSASDKIEFAKDLLPLHLRPGGHNPLSKFYGLTSAGLHGESDEDCLETFAQYRISFEYLFRNLALEDEAAKEFLQKMSIPAAKSKSATRKAPTH
jgi:hypothetical protein